MHHISSIIGIDLFLTFVSLTVNNTFAENGFSSRLCSVFQAELNEIIPHIH